MTFGRMEREYRKKIYAHALRLTRDTRDAEDATQETLIRAFKSFARIADERGPLPYLFRICDRVVLDLRRMQGRRIQAASLDAPLPYGEELYFDAEDTRIDLQAHVEAIEALESLPPDAQQLVCLTAEGFSQGEICDRIGVKKNSTVRSRRLRLHKFMTEFYAEAA